MSRKDVRGKVREEGLCATIATAWGYLRGYLVSSRFESRVFIKVRGKLRISTRYGTIFVGLVRSFGLT